MRKKERYGLTEFQEKGGTSLYPCWPGGESHWLPEGKREERRDFFFLGGWGGREGGGKRGGVAGVGSLSENEKGGKVVARGGKRRSKSPPIRIAQLDVGKKEKRAHPKGVLKGGKLPTMCEKKQEGVFLLFAGFEFSLYSSERNFCIERKEGKGGEGPFHLLYNWGKGRGVEAASFLKKTLHHADWNTNPFPAERRKSALILKKKKKQGARSSVYPWWKKGHLNGKGMAPHIT